MSFDSNVRLSSYASIAAAASLGGAATADLMIFDVGTTFTVESNAGLGGGPEDLAFFAGTVSLGALGTAIRFYGGQGFSSNPANSSSFFSGTGWSMQFAGVSPLGGKSDSGVRGSFNVNQSKFGPPLAHHFNVGDSVGNGSGSGTAGNAFAKGGKNFQFQLPDVPKSGTKAEGVVAGNTYIGFVVEAEGLNGVPAANYGWLDLTVGLNESNEFFLTVNRWAYETEMNEAARIPGVVPGVGGIAALAFGAAGIRRRRERIA
ncbi:MAG: hypothetical protein VX726_02305 [Planctomycetota bacterium]|nr:hypothetical protein [Planctomycetota bacterium]MEE2894551.1 hypothetical protein [Planctomycetota bacterium]